LLMRKELKGSSFCLSIVRFVSTKIMWCSQLYSAKIRSLIRWHTYQVIRHVWIIWIEYSSEGIWFRYCCFIWKCLAIKNKLNLWISDICVKKSLWFIFCCLCLFCRLNICIITHLQKGLCVLSLWEVVFWQDIWICMVGEMQHISFVCFDAWSVHIFMKRCIS
jgi:hypothetical protein